MSLTLDELRRNYARLSTEQLTRIATEEAAGLSPEGLEALRLELAARGASTDLFKAVEAQTKSWTAQEFDAYCTAVRRLPCPICNERFLPLNGTIVNRVTSFLLFTSRSTRPLVGCAVCLDNAMNHATVMTALLGWWGLPWGPIYSIRALNRNRKVKKEHHLPEANGVLRQLVLQRIGRITNLLDHPNDLVQYLKEENERHA